MFRVPAHPHLFSFVFAPGLCRRICLFGLLLACYPSAELPNHDTQHLNVPICPRDVVPVVSTRED